MWGLTSSLHCGSLSTCSWLFHGIIKTELLGSGQRIPGQPKCLPQSFSSHFTLDLVNFPCFPVGLAMHLKDVCYICPILLDIYACSPLPLCPPHTIWSLLPEVQVLKILFHRACSAFCREYICFRLSIFHIPVFGVSCKSAYPSQNRALWEGFWMAFNVCFFSAIFHQKCQSCLYLASLTASFLYRFLIQLPASPVPGDAMWVPRCPFLAQLIGCWFGLLPCVQTSLELCAAQDHSLPLPLVYPEGH